MIPFEGTLLSLRTLLFLDLIDQVGDHLNRRRPDCNVSLELIVTVHGIGYHTQCLRETASMSPTCRRYQRPSHQIPDHSRPSTQPVLNVWPGHLSVAGEGIRSEGSEPMRNGGLDQGSTMDNDREGETLSEFDQQIERNIAYSPGTTEELLRQQRAASVKHPHTGGKGALTQGIH